MSPPATAGSRLDFAVLGNAPEVLRWLDLVLSALPGVRVLDEGARHDPDGRLTGIVLSGLQDDDVALASTAGRLAVVLEDPVALLSGPEHASAAAMPARYRDAVRRLTGDGQTPPMVLGADELLPPRSTVAGLLVHLGVTSEVDGDALAPVSPAYPPPLSQSRRTVLFAGVREDVEALEQLAGRTFRSWRFSEQPEPAIGHGSTQGIFYAGRRRDVPIPPGLLGLDEWEVLPVRLGPLLDSATSLTVMDPMSFPFDALREGDRSIPIAARLPDGWTAPDLIATLGEPLLGQLGPYDAIAVGNGDVFSELRERYSWPATARIPDAALPAFAMGVVLDPDAPLRARKASDRVLRAAVRGEVAAGLAAVSPGERARALVLGDRVGDWASILPLGEAHVLGVDVEPRHVRSAAWRYPEWRFETDLPDEPETVHMALSVCALCNQAPDERRRRLGALFRSLRVGGRLILLDRFLDGRGHHLPGAPRPKALLGELRQAAGGHAVLTEVRALRLPGEDLTSHALFGAIKVGGTEQA